MKEDRKLCAGISSKMRVWRIRPNKIFATVSVVSGS